jgi:peroxiredoxin
VPKQAKQEPAVQKIEEEAIRGKKINVRWKEWIILVLVVLFVALVAALFIARQKGAVVGKIIGAGDRAPEFRLPAPDGRLVSLSDYKGKVVMVHFWATWCPPCVEEMPTLDALYRSLQGKDFEILAVSVDERGVDAVVPFLSKNRLGLPALLDPRQSIASLYGTYKFPETYLVDREGVVRHKVIGARDWSVPANVNIVREIIGNR